MWIKRLIEGTPLERPARRLSALLKGHHGPIATKAEQLAQEQARESQLLAEKLWLEQLKQPKLEKIRQILRSDMPFEEGIKNFNFLNDTIKTEYNIVDTENVSAHEYDELALALIQQHCDGLILDCGSGRRSHYYPNVVNFEIVPYASTDVLGVGEDLPFRDNAFDAVFSLNVLEHVKDPFKCAAEIARVMKPGAPLYCVVPFLQPFHAYPHHYYNMTAMGLKNMFDKYLTIEKQEVISSGLPIWTLSWFLWSWANGLEGKAKKRFLNMTVAELSANPLRYLDRDFVKNLSRDKNFELACTTALFATKKACGRLLS